MRRDFFLGNAGFALRAAGACVATFGAATLVLAACAATVSATDDGGTGQGEGGVDPKVCPACVSDDDCKANGGGVCAQFGSDIYCAPSCAQGEKCDSDRTCTVVTTAAGDQSSVCVPNNDACGASVGNDGGPASCGSTSADAGDPNQCGTMVGPPEKSSCTSCTGTSSGGHACQPNGCYGGWWCDNSTSKCHAPPTNCGSSGPPSGACAFDAGSGPITGNVGPTGGTASRLFFAVVGDTRPPTVNDTSGYPSAIIDRIYTDIESLSPKPLFAVSTGDYIFADPSNAGVGPQFDLYLTARKNFSGVLFPAMGNHECNGMTASNCGSGNTTGVTSNYTSFLSKMLGPINQTKPYYSIEIDASDKSWTAKFVFIAANAWDSAQASWLTTTLSQPTTYTFVIRHESSLVSEAPGVSPSESIMAAHPVTLAIVGHTHTYSHYRSTKQVIFGNGGAPLTGSGNYGFGLVTQRQDGTIEIDAMDYQSLQSDPSFRFAVHPDGTIAP